MEIVTSEEMRRIDRYAIESLRIPSLRLMEQAGARVAEAVQRLRCETPHARILVVCGKGNNGGDGLVAARHLHESDLAPLVLLTAEPASLTGDARASLDRARKAHVAIEVASTAAAWKRFRKTLPGFDVIVDALLGTGLSGSPRGLAATVIEDLGELTSAHDPEKGPRAGADRPDGPSPSPPAGSDEDALGAPGRGRGPLVVAVDIPSGLSGDSADAPEPAIRAAVTVALCRPKIAHVLPPACLRAGRVEVADIGIPPAAVASVKPRMFTIEPSDFEGFPPPRARDAHKGTFGHALVIAGSEGKAGAAALASRAALRAGAGLVTVATPAAVRPEVASFTPEVMTSSIPAGSRRAVIDHLLGETKGKSAVALGPGLGRGRDVEAWVRAFVRACPLPLVLDADGLNAFEGRAALLSARPSPLVLTPHPGEMARLLDTTTDAILRDRVAAARSLARTAQAIVVLKGMATLIAVPDGRIYVNRTGNPGMATGGTGDVLTGILAGLLAQRLDTLRAVLFGVHVHGRAGDLAALAIGEHSMIAGDILDRVHAAIRDVAHA